MADSKTIREHIRLIRELSNEMAVYLHTLPRDVWRYADRYPSACEEWNMADVVAHLIQGAIASTLSIQRSLQGNTSAPIGYQPLTKVEHTLHVSGLREAYDEELFLEFNVTCKRLNSLLSSLRPAEYDIDAWQTERVGPLSLLIEDRLIELGIHGWDIRYGLERTAKLSPIAVPLLRDWVRGWYLKAFKGGDPLEKPVTYRFEPEGDVTQGHDVVISGDEVWVSGPTSKDADVTFRSDEDTCILFTLGRMPFARSVRRGRLSFEGDEALAAEFVGWFRPL